MHRVRVCINSYGLFNDVTSNRAHKVEMMIYGLLIDSEL